MSKSEIHADVDRLKDIVSAMPVFAKDLAVGLEEIIMAVNRLGNTWRDDEFDQFKKCLNPLRGIIAEMIHELSQRQSDLEADVERLRQIQLKPLQ